MQKTSSIKHLGVVINGNFIKSSIKVPDKRNPSYQIKTEYYIKKKNCIFFFVYIWVENFSHDAFLMMPYNKMEKRNIKRNVNL